MFQGIAGCSKCLLSCRPVQPYVTTQGGAVGGLCLSLTHLMQLESNHVCHGSKRVPFDIAASSKVCEERHVYNDGVT